VSDPAEDARRAADAARAGIRTYEDAVLAEAERSQKLQGLNGAITAVRQADYASRFPAMRERA
jgi:hypothetical protein